MSGLQSVSEFDLVAEAVLVEERATLLPELLTVKIIESMDSQPSPFDREQIAPRRRRR
jgi:hypothetical protein